jgi:hypothetical protein
MNSHNENYDFYSSYRIVSNHVCNGHYSTRTANFTFVSLFIIRSSLNKNAINLYGLMFSVKKELIRKILVKICVKL